MHTFQGTSYKHLVAVQAHILRSLPHDVCAWSSRDVCTKSTTSIYIYIYIYIYCGSNGIKKTVKLT